MFATIRHLGVILLSIVLASENAFPKQVDEEASPTFNVRSILSPQVIRGPGYRIADRVSVADHRYQFDLVTEFGKFRADGIYVLEQRLREFHALERAQQLSGGRVAVNSAWQTVRQTGKGAGSVLSNPLGALSNAPRGIHQAAADIVNPLDRRAGGATRRRLAVRIGADPETRNPVLKRTLNQIAIRQKIGEGATKFALSAALPGLGLLSTVQDFQEQVAQFSPHEIATALDRELQQSGVATEDRKAFALGTQWTTTEKLVYMHYFRTLKNVPQANILIRRAHQAGTEAAILNSLAQIRILSELHREMPITGLVDAGFPVAVLRNGAAYGVYCVDYLTNSSVVQQKAADFRAANPERPLTFISTGYLSPRAQQLLARHQINFVRARYAAGNQPQAYSAQTAPRSGTRR